MKDNIANDIRLARNEYHRAWSKRNPDKVKAAQERYWTKRVIQARQTETVASV